MDWRGLFLPRINRKPSRESRNPPNPEDLERLEELREQGSRLKLPHPVRGHLVFDSETSARQAADPLSKEGFSCTVRSAPDGSWVLTAIVQVVPTPGALTKLREQFEAVTAAYGGSYRGWDAPIVY
ncbi:MAG TPA: ribonuclease E inhibitor RraB [Candidatus Dormibacteraeota bacterium]|nr:ribonuclease E inhibitor RraB [Candidatus Dormibacteraeota bacterium]